ncbi:MAG: decaprenyl-phosphate phosphoribosyltransferase [Deltaproteobacteria bacterium]|nr:decaprenyl-phosphate phosphoribosyltransferase [Deltaproteobacteria bacterium]
MSDTAPAPDPGATPPRGPSGAGDLLLAMVQGLRPKQWAKNVFVLAAILFSMNFGRADMWVKVLAAFATFSMFSSAGYLFNDASDVEADRKHPTKRKRAIASGRLPLPVAYAEMVGLLIVGGALGWWVSPWLVLIASLYLVTTLSYSFYFKHVVILDVMFISAGFLWRAAAGAVAIDVAISPWLMTCTAFVSLFFGFNKRRGELTLMEEQAKTTRKILSEYSHDLVVEFQAITTSGTIISYALYCVQGSPTPWLLLTLPIVVYCVLRYMYLVSARNEGGAPDETLFKDAPILAAGLLYGLTVVGVLMLAPHKGA